MHQHCLHPHGTSRHVSVSLADHGLNSRKGNGKSCEHTICTLAVYLEGTEKVDLIIGASPRGGGAGSWH
jgi:hypothetical protein